MSGAIADFAERIRACAASGSSLCLRGGGSKDFYGGPPLGEALNTREHAGIVAYEPSELFITARCGTPLAHIESELNRNGQMLAFEPPHFGSDATIGGAVAAGLSGPRRASAGALRDFVLGVTLMDGRRDVLTFGGQVMKNVAGYDVSRLMAGSMGTLGLILEVSLKTSPSPKVEVTLLLEMPEAKAIDAINQWAARPLPISAVAWNDGDLGVRLSGAEAAVVAAAEKLGGARVEPVQAERFWRGIREHIDPYFNTDKPLWRISAPSNAPTLGLPGEQLIEWNGALRWLATNVQAHAIREVASKLGGHATLFRGGDKAVGVFHPLSAPLMAIHQRLKNVFDPGAVFNRGRMYGEF